MLITVTLRLILSFFSVIDQVVFPSLPDSFGAIFQTFFQYLAGAVGFLRVFFDFGYLSQLLVFWIAFGALAFTIELIYRIWQLVHGTGHDAAVEGS